MVRAEIDVSPFSFDEAGDSHFEQLAKTNGTRYWYARDLMRSLGYDNWTSFKKAINKAMAACATLDLPIQDNFVQCKTIIDSKSLDDFKLSRFACCLTALNGDSKKANVAAAQAYFISLASVLHDLPVPSDAVDRIVIRDEISELEVSLTKAAATAGVKFYGQFQNAGYRGMYNMEYSELKRLKNIPDMQRSLLDFMNKDELAGNLFRLTLTEGRIHRDKVSGQVALEGIAEQVGRRVRQAMIDETGNRPEDLPIGPDIKQVRKGLKKTNQAFGKFVDDVTAERVAQATDTRSAAKMIEITSTGMVPGCSECRVDNRASHFGSSQCTSGSLQSGGVNAHCTCDYCMPKSNE